MKLLAIETSCDETAVTILEGTGDAIRSRFRILGNALISQVETHQAYGGVFPALAKREHAKNITPLIRAVLEEAELAHEATQALPEAVEAQIVTLLEREPQLTEVFLELVRELEPPSLDAICVTAGPGLEPALWVGINVAKALSLVWGIPLVAVNHMEGHIVAGLLQNKGEDLVVNIPELPLVALLISGGHTELVAMREWLSYELLGATKDDAVGEAFDKVARMLGLPYPGGPEISNLAEQGRNENLPSTFAPLPRPMLHDNTCDFSFSGLKTSVLYTLKARGELNDTEKKELAREFEDAVSEVLWKKTASALEKNLAKTLVIGGGVSANTHIRRVFEEHMRDEYPQVKFYLPKAEFTTDNAIMIGIAGYYRTRKEEFSSDIRAEGNLSLT